MSVAVFAPGVSVEVFAGAPPATAPAAGNSVPATVTVYAGGYTVAVLPRAPLTVPVIHAQALDVESDPAKPGYRALRDHTCLDIQFPRGQAYYRTGNGPLPSIFTTLPFSLGFGTTGTALRFPKYGLLLDGVEVATRTVAAGARSGVFSGSWPAGTPSRPHQLDIVGYDAAGNRVVSPVVDATGKTIATLGSFRVWFDLDGTAKNWPYYFAQIANFTWSHPSNQSYDAARYVAPTYGWVDIPKAAIADVPLAPLATRPTIDPFNTTITSAGWHRIDLISGTSGNDYLETYEPNQTDSGITLTENEQQYFTRGFMADQPYSPIIPGPRGIARASHFTFLKFTERPAPFLKLLWGNNYAVGAFDHTGAMAVHFGLCSTYAPNYADVARAIAAGVLHKSLVVKGIWQSSVPILQRHALRPWFHATDHRTTRTNPNEPTIGGEAPHGDPATGAPLNPTSYVGDDHGWILRATSNGHDRSIEPTVDRFIPERVWGGTQGEAGSGVFENQLITGSRYTHRIAVWDMLSGNHVTDILSVPQAATIGSIDPGEDMFVYAPGKTVADARALPLCFVEGMAGPIDGWLYFASLAQQEVRRVHMVTGQLQIVCRVPVFLGSGQSKFINIDVSDGSFWPRHTVGTQTFDNQLLGRPRFYLPTPRTDTDGTPLTHTEYGVGSYGPWGTYSHDLLSGSPTVDGVYPMCMAFGRNGLGALACGGSEASLPIYVKRLATDPVYDDTKAKAGHQDYRARLQQLIWNTMAASHVSFPLPRGENANKDYWLNALQRP